MSKELEAFTRVKESLLHAVGGNGEAHYKGYSDSAKPAEEDLDIIETALKDYEKTQRIVGTTTISEALKQFLIQQCLEVKKQLKALEIIKREPSEVIEDITTYDTWEEYIKDFPIRDRTILHIIKNKNEFDLLKEVLL